MSAGKMLRTENFMRTQTLKN